MKIFYNDYSEYFTITLLLKKKKLSKLNDVLNIESILEQLYNTVVY